MMRSLRSAPKLVWMLLSTFVLVLSVGILSAQEIVTTYHYDNNRTGWNSKETKLTPTTVASASFGMLKSVALDDQVDAQPLVVTNINITAGSHLGKHNVVYVATEGNTVYAIDANSGTILLSANFGAPVPKPLHCGNNGPNVGINSTPVIDPKGHLLYVMVYNQTSSGPAYFLHSLDLGNLTDKIPAVQVSASHMLTDGTTYVFNASVQRQRPALLVANGNVYAGFGSFCDFSPSLSRGWLLGWKVNTMVPLPANEILDTQPTSPNNYFLSSIWMSGYGPAADSQGNILFVTGNSDPAGTTYDGVSDIQESVVKVSGNLTTVLDKFTPKNVASLDQTDDDFGSGGAMVLPNQPGSVPHLVVAAGKNGSMFLMNGDNLGGFSTTTNNVLQTVQIGACWCGPSYFVDSDGAARIVTSGAKTAEVWKLQTSPTQTLTKISTSPSIGGGQFPGFFTTISSNGKSNFIIWALSHPASTASNGINLFAFNPEAGGATMTQLFTGAAGTWPNTGGNSNLVPVVANGKVYVVSNKELRIFGLHQ